MTDLEKLKAALDAYVEATKAASAARAAWDTSITAADGAWVVYATARHAYDAELNKTEEEKNT